MKIRLMFANGVAGSEPDRAAGPARHGPYGSLHDDARAVHPVSR
jgi:hypothetical protein